MSNHPRAIVYMCSGARPPVLLSVCSRLDGFQLIQLLEKRDQNEVAPVCRWDGLCNNHCSPQAAKWMMAQILDSASS